MIGRSRLPLGPSIVAQEIEIALEERLASNLAINGDRPSLDDDEAISNMG